MPTSASPVQPVIGGWTTVKSSVWWRSAESVGGRGEEEEEEGSGFNVFEGLLLFKALPVNKDGFYFHPFDIKLSWLCDCCPRFDACVLLMYVLL